MNPLETWTLSHLTGRVLDLGCGLGNLSLAAARAGHDVDARDACGRAVADLERRAQALALHDAFAEWTLLLDRIDDFPAPDGNKRFATVIARRSLT